MWQINDELYTDAVGDNNDVNISTHRRKVMQLNFECERYIWSKCTFAFSMYINSQPWFVIPFDVVTDESHHTVQINETEVWNPAQAISGSRNVCFRKWWALEATFSQCRKVGWDAAKGWCTRSVRTSHRLSTYIPPNRDLLLYGTSK